MTKYRLTYETVIDVWAENEEEAIEKGNEERLNGTYDALFPDVEEKEDNKTVININLYDGKMVINYR